MVARFAFRGKRIGVLGFTTGDTHITRDLRYNPGGVLHTMPYRDLYEEAPPERGTIFRLQVLGVGISLLEVYEQYMKLGGKSLNFVCKKAQND